MLHKDRVFARYIATDRQWPLEVIIFLFAGGKMAGQRHTRQNHSIQHLLDMTPSTSRVTRNSPINLTTTIASTVRVPEPKLTATPKKVRKK